MELFGVRSMWQVEFFVRVWHLKGGKDYIVTHIVGGGMIGDV